MKSLFFLFFFLMLLSCTSSDTDLYHGEVIIDVDTLHIERIKIPTH